MPNNDMYAYSVGRVRAMESRLLDSGRIERMVEAKSADDALKVLAESEYAEHLADLSSVYEYEKVLDAELRSLYLELRKILPNPQIIRLFSRRFDYHNLKVLFKAKYRSENRDELLVREIGNISADELIRAVSDEDFRSFSPYMRQAAKRITEQFRLDADPQLIDILLDRAMFEETARDLGVLEEPFLTGYFARLTDLLNIKTFLRVRRQNRSKDFLENALLPAGELQIAKMFQLSDPLEVLIDRLAFSEYAKVVEEGIVAYQKTDTLTRYEKLVDDFLIKYIRQAKYVSFGPEPAVGYLLAKENEIKIIRIILVGKINQLPVEEIKERLRDVYV